MSNTVERNGLFTIPKKRNETRLIFWCRYDGENTMICKRNVKGECYFYMSIVGREVTPDIVSFNHIATRKESDYTKDKQTCFYWILQLVQLYLESNYESQLLSRYVVSRCEFLDKEIF